MDIDDYILRMMKEEAWEAFKEGSDDLSKEEKITGLGSFCESLLRK